MKKVALITGAGKRLGREFALHLSKGGYEIALHFNSSRAGAEATKSEIEALGGRAELFQKDLKALYGPRELIQEVEKKFGKLDLLINSASTFPSADRIESNHRLEDETEAEWEEALAVNARAPFFLMKYAARLLGETGTIINILDESAVSPAVSRAAHSVSKGALLSATKLAEKTFSGRRRVHALVLGNILPGEKMSAEEREKVSWEGVERVLKELDRYLREEPR